MKNIFYVIIALVTFTSCQKQAKIGFVDNGILINEYQEKKDLEAKFQLKEEAFRKKFDSIDASFQLEVQKFQSQAQKMAPNKAQEKYQELGKQKQLNDQQKQVDAQQFQQDFQTKIDTIIVKVKDYVKNYGKTNGFTYILGTSDSAATVLYGTDENDLTNTILESLNKAYKK